MSTHRTMTGTGARTTDEYVADRSGWVTFAGVMLSIVGVLNIVYGIAAIDSANFYISDARFVISNLSLWGWVLLVMGTVQFCAAFSIFAGTAWGRWVGILTAGLNSIAQLMLLPAYPFLALALFSVDILVIYGLLADSGRSDRI
ncbi:MAG: hypothetical protein JWN65_997 [Solirubrobacterales bacterium]|nr:hypothetical protein [Solirubrobacterales bacterium]